ncbi:DUF6212 domain-containing protein [Bosea sp. BIWAKO-01]|uniref:DUF6212 domain-containing protein n=1 Tax=Bosea sp. BIWAKO-01 TaxID=506668 RepID=UPI000853B5E7|nr:DUF6212 domain-containing protein [Bosea sp. BIWAKO-01]GAU86334.1 hypothetical protein BIWAKO_06282 [Bosea sp. BIWAKO-01]
MALQTTKNLLRRLYSADPKIIVLSGPGPSAARAMPASALHWYGCKLVECDHYLLTVDGQAEEALPSALCNLEIPPTNVWALWAPDPIKERSLRVLQAWWTKAGGTETPVPCIVGHRAELDAVILERSLRETRKLQQSNQLLMRDLAALRESWTHHVRIPPELEELVATLRMGRPQLIFNSPLPGGDVDVPAHSTEPDATAAEPRLLQRLPTSARGWLGLDLHVADPGQGAGCLCAEIEASDAGTVLAQWRVPFDMLCRGWLPLRLPSPSSCTSRSLTLKVWATGGEVAPRLSTCSAGVMHEYRLAPQNLAQPDERDAATMLAMKLWGGLPGIRPLSSQDDGKFRHEAGAIIPVPDSVVGKVHLTREQSAAYPVFGYMEQGKVLLRPLKTTSSAAVISLPATPGLIEISCEVMIDDKRCQTRRLGARLVVTPHGIGPDDAESGQNVLAATEWTELNEPLAPSRLVARLPFVQNRPVDLHLLTRLPEPGPIPPHGRVVFGRFEAEIHAASAWGMAPVLPDADDRTALT